MLYDVTSTYLEGSGCELGKSGYNRDKKKGKTQIVFGLLCDAKGCPIAVEVFEGNTSDSATLGLQIEKVRNRFGLKNVVWVKVRPIYHYKGDRVKAHIFLCMLAYYVEWHLRQKLAPLLFEDEEIDDDSQDVIKARRSEAAQTKDRRKRNTDNFPVHSFRTLLADLGTICLNTVQCTLKEGSYRFSKVTRPTSLQQKALDLLGISLICTQ